MIVKDKIKRLSDLFLLPLRKINSKLQLRIKRRHEHKMIVAKSKLHRNAVERIREKQGPINVVFFALFESVWKFDELYNIMARDKRFNPTILVCPVVNYGKVDMIRNMDKCYDLFKQRGYNVLKSYNPVTDQYVDVRKDLDPDIIFYTNPYEGLIDDRYYIKNFLDILTCYTPYGIFEDKHFAVDYDILLNNLLWKQYLGFPYHMLLSKKYSRVKGANAFLSGYPGIDRFINKGEKFEDVWKIKDRSFKRIIWAPHHTIDDYVFVSYSTFLSYCDFMFEMAAKYKDSIQITFKPHPLLKNRLELLWGKDKTNEYYDRWAKIENGMLNDGAYEDLFMTSDAIIHDSGSFIGEYLYMKKPAMFLSNGRPFDEQYNDFAIKCLENYYIGKTKEDIEKFIKDLIEGKDSLKHKREEFYQNELLPPNGKLASENIVDNIVKELRS